MKSKRFLSTLVSILLLLNISIGFKSSSQLKGLLKSISEKDRSLFTFEDRIENDNDQDSFKFVQNPENSKEKEKESKSDDENPEKNSNSNKTKPPTSKFSLIKQGWLKISSQDLQDEERYKKIPLKKGKEQTEFEKIELTQVKNGKSNPGYSGQQFFRKNKAFKKGSSIPDDASFWFRISGSNLYYTATEKDMNVLGAIAVKNVVSIDQSLLGEKCLKVSNQENDQWDLCTHSAAERESWECALMKAMGKECKKSPANNVKVIHEKEIQKQPIILIPLPSPYCNENFNYLSHGSDWNCKCKEGFKQSPIDIQYACSRKPNSLSLNKSAVFQWKKLPFIQVQLIHEDSILKIKCKGDDDDCRDFSMGSVVDYDFVEFQAIEIQFHTPSDHTLQGQQYPLEIQIIFKPVSKGYLKEKAAVSFLVEKQPGIRNKFFQNWDLLQLPNILEQKGKFPNQDSIFSVVDLFSWNDHEEDYQGYFGYAYYEGSLTSPPCDEHVRWFVVDNAIAAGMTTIEMIRDSIVNVPKTINDNIETASEVVSKSSDGNNRSLQPQNDRKVYHFDIENNECYPHSKHENKKDKGHFEKVEVKANSYIYVPGEKPSGIENSYIVTREEALGKQSNENKKNEQNQE